jgi:hypothetical protein
MAVRSVSRSHRQEVMTDESSSWLGDDVCTNCGAPARPNHLYCSQECKEEDAKQVDSSKPSGSLKAAPALPLAAASSVKKTASVPMLTEANDSTKFRYPCPPSPNIVAKYNSALTSPALVALERSLPNLPSTTSTIKGSHSISSSGDSSGMVRAKSSKRRSSSRSTFSSASDAISTEQSTPQSTSEVVQDEEDEDALDASDFRLPPSVRPSTLMLSSTATEADMAVTPSTSVTPDGIMRSPVSKVTPTSHRRSLPTKTSAQSDAAARKTLEFARRPSTTNISAALAMTSPVLNSVKGSFGETTRRMSGRQSQASLREAQLTLRGRKSSGGRAIPTTSEKEKDFASRLDMIFQQHRGKADNSPPNLASASSSADKTLRALSPYDKSSPASHGSICGRYECSGLGSSVELLQDVASPRRPSINRGHKHTHSAAAGLNFLGNDNNTTSQLLMTPVVKKLDLEDESLIKEDIMDSSSTSFEERVRHPPRGRSKARGRRSASRRSPSPARGAARRGRSEDLLNSGVVEEQSLPRISPTSARSQPMAFPQGRRSSGNEESSDEVGEERRGRSLTERDVPLRTFQSRERESMNSTTKSGDTLDDSCEMAWPGYGHDIDTQGGYSKAVLAQNIASAILHGSKGYDDVDLDEL